MDTSYTAPSPSATQSARHQRPAATSRPQRAHQRITGRIWRTAADTGILRRGADDECVQWWKWLGLGAHSECSSRPQLFSRQDKRWKQDQGTSDRAAGEVLEG